MELEQYLSGRLLKGSCLDTLKQLPDNSIDSIVTDPPYELGFLGKKWDSSGIAYNIDLWKECLRVLKPGGHLLAFSGSRTYHRMVVAIEDAGFEIRDSIHWTYGTGFPKGQNIAKSVEGKLTTGSSNTKDFKKLKGTLSPSKSGGSASLQKANFKEGIRPSVYVSAGELTLEPTTKEAKDFMGWSTALKPSHEPIVMARKPIEVTVAETIIKYGTGGVNIDATRVGDRYTANTILTHNYDCTALCTDGCPVAIMDETNEASKFFYNSQWTQDDNIIPFVYQAKPSKSERNKGLKHLPKKNASKGAQDKWTMENMPFNNEAENFHPTVKPIQLMSYLIKLVTKPGGKVLDPFLGSGTTAVSAILGGFDWVGCELTEEYYPIIEGRISWARKEKERHDCGGKSNLPTNG